MEWICGCRQTCDKIIKAWCGQIFWRQIHLVGLDARLVIF
jgi:hypothetical protein